jgi:hypothetical protein
MGIRTLVILMVLSLFPVWPAAAQLPNDVSLSVGERFEALQKQHAETLARDRQDASERDTPPKDYLVALVAKHRRYRIALLDLRHSAIASDDDDLAALIGKEIEKAKASILEAEERLAQGEQATIDPGDRLPEGLARNLALHYRFDRSYGSKVIDASGLGNDGAAHGARRSVSGRRKGAFWFDGIDDYIETPDTESLQTDGELTLSVCVFREPDEGMRTDLSEQIVSKADVSGADYRLAISGNHTLGAILRHQKAGEPQIRIDSDPAKREVAIRKWVHIVFVYDGHVAHTYVDGERDKTIAAPGGIGVTNAPLNIGRCGNGSWQYGFTGRVDDVLIWNRALSEAEILGLWVSLKRSAEKSE